MQETIDFKYIEKIIDKYTKPYKTNRSIVEDIDFECTENVEDVFQDRVVKGKNLNFLPVLDTLEEDNEFFLNHSSSFERCSPEAVYDSINESQPANENSFQDDMPCKEDNNKCSVGNKSVIISASYFYHNVYKHIRSKYVFKCCNGIVNIYNKQEGRFKQLGDIALKTIIRDDWDDETQAKLTKGAVSDIIDRLKTDSSLQANIDDFNPYEHLTNMQNGVLNLKTGERLNHSQEYNFNYCVQANYTPNPKGGSYLIKFIKTCTDSNPEKERQLQQMIGYAISSLYTGKKASVLIGKPHSGKSLLLSLTTSVIGSDFVSHVPLHKLSNEFILAHIHNKRANICNEINDQALSNLDTFKSIVGNDEMVACYKGKDHFSFQSKIKLMFSGNEMASLKKLDKTSAFFDRLIFLTFNYTVPEAQRDHNLKDKLIKYDKDYFVWWAMEGARRLLEQNYVFSECKESNEFKKKYISEQNHVKDFVNIYCLKGPEHKIHLTCLHDEYLQYCKNNCFLPFPREKFFAEISKEDVEKCKFRVDGSNALWGYKGIKVTSTPVM